MKNIGPGVPQETPKLVQGVPFKGSKTWSPKRHAGAGKVQATRSNMGTQNLKVCYFWLFEFSMFSRTISVFFLYGFPDGFGINFGIIFTISFELLGCLFEARRFVKINCASSHQTLCYVCIARPLENMVSWIHGQDWNERQSICRKGPRVHWYYVLTLACAVTLV